MKRRLDLELLERGMVRTRSRASDLIRSGAVSVNGVTQSKAGYLVAPEDEVALSTATPAFEVALQSVGRGAVKLDFALAYWNIPVSGLCIDVGASTGGFTEILLKNGAELVVAVDVGRDQLDPSLRKDERVISLEGLDIRTIVSREALASAVERHHRKKADGQSDANPSDADPSGVHPSGICPSASKDSGSKDSGAKNTGIKERAEISEERILAGANVITCDVSFVSLTKVLPSIQKLGGDDCHFVFLIKPQFETEERKKRKKGIVNSAKDRDDAVRKVTDFASGLGLNKVGLAESPIKGGDGNIEYLAYFKHSGSRS